MLTPRQLATMAETVEEQRERLGESCARAYALGGIEERLAYVAGGGDPISPAEAMGWLTVLRATDAAEVSA